MLPKKLLHRLRRRKNVPLSKFEPLEVRRLLSAATELVLPDFLATPDKSKGKGAPSVYTPADGYTPSEIETAYGFNQVADNGAGTTIAIVDAYNDANLSADLGVFDSAFGLPAPPSFSQVSQTGGAATKVPSNAGWAVEESLDVEWAHAIAPAANIVLVEASSSSISNLLTAVNYARNLPNVNVVSMSWGSSEFQTESQFDGDFTTPTGHVGETFVAASGDEGAFDGAEWPASSANVLSVGGTTLFTTLTGGYDGESGWSDSTGGISLDEGEPAFQDVAQNTGARATPDVSYDANPNSGFAVYDSIADQGFKGWQEIGGTSAGSPQWSALVAIADQQREADHLTSLNGPTQTLPTLYSIYSGPASATYVNYATTFHDIVTGQSSFDTSASAGYDLVTGLGSPNVPAIVNLLVNGSVTITYTPPPKPPAPPKRTIYGLTSFVATPAASPAVTPAALPGISTSSTNVAAADIQSAGTTPMVHAAPTAVTKASAAATPAPRAAITERTTLGSVWLEAMGVASADVAAITKVEHAVNVGIHNAVQLADSAAAEAGAAARAAATTMQPHVIMQLAQLDARVFADALRAFAHESAALESTIPANGWSRLLAATAAAIMADTILVGYWYMGRTKRRGKAEAAARNQ
jgi:subtilase family serine protease